jgi:16S rRNA (cytidine1402-2'-O)-methyltransferase
MLLLLPNLLSEEASHTLFLPVSVESAVRSLDGLIAESPKGGRYFLRRFCPETFREIPIELLNEHTPDSQIDALLKPLREGKTWGLVSDCGLPCLADPGAKLVARARQLGIPIQVFAGPSAILFALMLSGLSAQSFAFHGYLEKDQEPLVRQLVNLQKQKSTQIFIEAPYRNQKMLEQLVKTLSDETQLCVAWDLTLPTQGIVCQPVRVWKKSPLPDINKKPAVFLFRGY